MEVRRIYRQQRGGHGHQRSREQAAGAGLIDKEKKQQRRTIGQRIEYKARTLEARLSRFHGGIQREKKPGQAGHRL